MAYTPCYKTFLAMEIDDILEKYGSYGITGRVIFKHHAYIMVA